MHGIRKRHRIPIDIKSSGSLGMWQYRKEYCLIPCKEKSKQGITEEPDDRIGHVRICGGIGE